MPTDEDVPVLIVGASLVGLSCALLLARHGIRALAVEHHPGTAIHPRAAHASQRTLEIFRSVGLEEPVCRRSAEQFVQDGGIVGVETLFGGPVANYIENLNAGVRDVSPSERVFLSQDALEPLLRERAVALGATLRFNTDVESLEQDDEGVTARLRDRETGAVTQVRARYAIAADGARGRLRAQLGIGLTGRPAFSHSATVYFRADLKELLADRRWAVVYANNTHLRGFFRFEKPFERAFLAVNTLGPPDHPDTDVTRGLDDARAIELVHQALGDESVPVAIERIMTWDAAAQVAERFRASRVFLAGDAAHVMPPTGGFGGNTGVQDAHNLAWKLAMVLEGAAGAALLDSYEAERLPTARLTVDQAYTRYVLRTDPTLRGPDLSPIVDDLQVELGYVYRSAAILSEPEATHPGHLSPRETRGLPGTRAPHLWLQRNGERISTLDLYGDAWTLLCGRDAMSWNEVAVPAASALRLRLDVHRPGSNGLVDHDGALETAHGIEATGCVLVRPDGFVAWRAANDREASPEALVARVSRCLGR